MPKFAWLAPILLLVQLAPIAARGAWEPVWEYGRFCNRDESLCFQGRIDFEPNQKLVEVRGRITRTANQPGELLFGFTGRTPQNEAVYHAQGTELHDRYRALVTFKFRPPYSSRTDWTLSELRFRPENSAPSETPD